MADVSRTRATLRRAEFGFFGVVVYTRVHTPRRWGAPFKAGVLVFSVLVIRPLRTSCWIVGTRYLRAEGVRTGARPTDDRTVSGSEGQPQPFRQGSAPRRCTSLPKAARGT